MPILIGEKQQAGSGYYLKRMITCPGHWLVPPQVDVYLREPVPLLKDCSDFVELKGKRINIKKTRIVHDKFGNKVVDWKKMYELRKKGIVLHPQVSAAWAIEHVYDPESFLCAACDKRCREGLGKIVTSSINRLSGIPMRGK